MANKYQQYPAYQSMLKSGLNERIILEEIRNCKEAFEGFSISDEMQCFLVARNLIIDSQKPNIKRKFIPIHTSNIKISQLNDVSDNEFIDIKGKIVNAFFDANKVSFYFTDMKTAIRCSLYDDSMYQFKDKHFLVGETIKIKNVKVKTYKGKKELYGGYNTRILKIKSK